VSAPAIEVRLYGGDGSTFIRVLSRRRGLQVLEEFNGVGSGTVTVPSDDAAGVSRDRIIKVAYDGTEVAAFIIEKIERAQVSADGLVWLTLSGRGMLAWLEDAVTYPQGSTLAQYSPSDRPFNFAGTGGGFDARTSWYSPLGFRQKDATDHRAGYPKGWPDRNAYWIWRTNPASSTSANARNWFKATLTTTTTKRVRLYASCDGGGFQFFIDGALMVQTSDLQKDGPTWRRMATRVLSLPAGTHKLAAYATNGVNGSPSGKAGFMACIAEIDTTGKPTQVLRHTDLTNWSVASSEPKWYPSEIARALIDDATARGVSRVGYLTVDWSATLDSSSRAWSTLIATTIRCGTNLLDVIATLVDHGVDFWADPATNRLKAYETRGSDKSATVLLKGGKNLTAYETAATSTGKTAALVRSADGWTEASNSTGVSTYGRRETYYEFGNTASEATAAAAASRILSRTARTTIDVQSCTTVPTADTRPFLDYSPGDRVSAYSSTGTLSSARVLSLALVEAEDGTLTCEHDLEVLV